MDIESPKASEIQKVDNSTWQSQTSSSTGTSSTQTGFPKPRNRSMHIWSRKFFRLRKARTGGTWVPSEIFHPFIISFADNFQIGAGVFRRLQDEGKTSWPAPTLRLSTQKTSKFPPESQVALSGVEQCHLLPLNPAAYSFTSMEEAISWPIVAGSATHLTP